MHYMTQGYCLVAAALYFDVSASNEPCGNNGRKNDCWQAVFIAQSNLYNIANCFICVIEFMQG